jgi:cbb3-type cytochrome oxidase cytochrome c subunit
MVFGDGEVCAPLSLSGRRLFMQDNGNLCHGAVLTTLK